MPDLEFAHAVLAIDCDPIDHAPILDLRLRKGIRRRRVRLAVASGAPVRPGPERRDRAAHRARRGRGAARRARRRARRRRGHARRRGDRRRLERRGRARPRALPRRRGRGRRDPLRRAARLGRARRAGGAGAAQPGHARSASPAATAPACSRSPAPRTAAACARPASRRPTARATRPSRTPGAGRGGDRGRARRRQAVHALPARTPTRCARTRTAPRWEAALGAAQNVIAHASFLTETVREHATVVFPAEVYPEKEGTTVHPDGRVQRVRTAVARRRPEGAPPGAGVRAGWQVIAEVAQRAGHDLGVHRRPDGLRSSSSTPCRSSPGLTLDAIGGRGVRWPADRGRRRPRAPSRGSRPSSPSPRSPARPTARCCGSAPGARCGRPRRSTTRPCCSSCAPRQLVELSPADAERIGVLDGDPVEVAQDGVSRARHRAAARGDPARLGVPRRGHDRGAGEPADRRRSSPSRPPGCPPPPAWRTARDHRLRRGRLLRALVDPAAQGAR